MIVVPRGVCVFSLILAVVSSATHCGGRVVVLPSEEAKPNTAGDERCGGAEQWVRIDAPLRDFAMGGWTGDDLILWPLDGTHGYRFHSEANDWRSMQETPPLGTNPTYLVSAMASGRFFVWDTSGGGAYDWRLDAWSVIMPMGGNVPPPDARVLRPAVGAPGHLFYVGVVQDGAGEYHLARRMYDVTHDTWSTLPGESAPMAVHSLVAWVGHELVVWGGVKSVKDEVPVNGGARFDPSTNMWSKMTPTNAPAPMSIMVATAVSMGQTLFVWGESTAGVMNGGIYDPSRDEWKKVRPDRAPARSAYWSVWTGKEVVVIGSSGGSGIYSPNDDSWRSMAPPPRDAVWQVVVWDGCRVLAYAPGNFYAYNPRTSEVP